jgi:hypothetical protein
MMRSIPRLAVAVVVLALGAGAGAEPGRGAGGGPGPHGRVYDPKTVETVAGEVLAVERVAGPGGGPGGVHVALRTDATGTLSVRLGPAWYVDRQATKLAAGDRIEVRGSRVTIDGAPVVIAAEVRRGAQKLLLRDDAGVPYWSGGRRGAQP